MPAEPDAAARAAIAQFAQRALPGDGPVGCTEYAAGARHATYRVWRGGRAFALRVPREVAARTRAERDFERRVLGEAARAGLAPPLAYADERSGALALPWVDGGVWTAAEARSAGGLAAVAGLARRIHALAVPQPARAVTPAQWVSRYRHALAAAAPRAPSAFGIPDAAVQARLQAWARLAAPANVLCHGDLHVGNLILARGRLWLIDWEYAHVSHPFWDLAGWIANADLGPAEARDLLAAYLEREPAAAELEALAVLVWLFDYVCLQWSALALAAGAGSAAAQIAAHAEVRAARLAAAAPVVA